VLVLLSVIVIVIVILILISFILWILGAVAAQLRMRRPSGDSAQSAPERRWTREGTGRSGFTTTTLRGAFRNLIVLGRSGSSMVDFVLKIGLQRLTRSNWPRIEFATGALVGRRIGVGDSLHPAPDSEVWDTAFYPSHPSRREQPIVA
jgi:hypothetical protein